MATIQIWDVPDHLHEELQRQAREAGPLLTADARLANAPGLPCAVELVAWLSPSAPASSRSS